MVDIWMNVTKNGEYTSIKAPYNKETKKPNPWPSIHVSTTELTWTEDSGNLILICMLTSPISGVKVGKANEEKIKYPIPFKVVLSEKSDSKAEQALIKVLKSTTEPNKFYSGFFTLNDENPVNTQIVTGVKADGLTALTAQESGFLSTQICNFMEVTQSLLTTEILDTVKKTTSDGNGYQRQAVSETLEQRYSYRLEILKTYLFLDDTKPITILDAWSKTPEPTKNLLEILLR